MPLLWCILVFVVVAVATVPLDWKSQLELGIFTFLIGLLLNRFFKQQVVTLALILLSLFSSARYFYWRVSETVRLWSESPGELYFLDMFFICILLAAEAYTFVILLLGYFQTAHPLRRAPLPLPADIEKWPAVDVFIPTYNEPLAVVRPTVLASLSIDWPTDKLKVFILDDGRRPEFRKFAEECGCGYLTRTDNAHAKAGNLNSALTKTDAEYIAIFDCDHVPTRSFLQITMGWMLNQPRLGLVQTPHHFYSPDPFERNLGTFRDVPNEGALFYGVVQDGNDLWNGTFFCGSCAVIRRKALNEIGGIAVETVTEDAHTSLRMQRRGWNTAYINIPQAAGLATTSLVAHIGQRIRWARGMVQIFRIDNPLLGRGLKFHQRLCYLNACLHYLGSGPRLVFLTSPLIYLLLWRSNILGYFMAVFAYGFPHIFLGPLANSRVQSRHRFFILE